MANMVLAMPVLSDAATLSASNSAGTLPIGNLQKRSLKEVWRALDPENAFIIIDLGEAKEINLVALLGHNGSSRASGRVRAASTEGDLTTSPGYDSGLLPFRSHQSGYDASWASGVADEEYGALDKNMFLLWLGNATETYRYWRIDIDDPNISFLDVGRLYISKAWQPQTNMDYGLAEGFIDPSRKPRTVSGEVSPVQRQAYRYSEFQLSFLNEAAMYDNVFEIERLRGRSKDVLFIQDPEATDHLQRRSVYGLMESLQPIINYAFSLFQKTFRIEEIPS